MSSTNVDDTMCQDCGNHNGIISEQLESHTMCQACKDIALFKQPPPNEDCPICFLPVPSLATGIKYQGCCGKILCSGCIYAVDKMKGKTKCPFCRVPEPESDEEIRERTMKRVEMDDAEAIYNLGCYYDNGGNVLPQDSAKALELWHRSGELGNAFAYYNIGCAYDHGEGVERDIEKARHYYELAAIGGNVSARYNLGIVEEDAGNMSIALKHYMIAAGYGDNDSLKEIQELFKNGHATRDDYAKALQAYQKYIDRIKSPQRDEAALFDSDFYRYY